MDQCIKRIWTFQIFCLLFSLLVELLYLCYHVLDLLVNLQEVGIEDSLTRLDGREVIELRQRVLGIGFLLLGNLGHVEVGLAEELAGLELLGLLDVHAAATACLGLDEVAGCLTADPACGHVGNLRVWD